MRKTNLTFMAFGKSQESTEGVVVKKYVGVGSVYVLAVNPTKAELEKLYNTTLDNNPEYLGETEVGPDGARKKVPQVRLDFIVKTDPEKNNGIDFVSRISFFLAKEFKYNRDRTKVQVINRYGETTWLSIEDAKAGRIPDNLKWFEPADFRPAYVGEAELTDFLKAYLNIPSKSYVKKNGERVDIPNKADAEARLEKIESYFKNDFSELSNCIKMQPNNKVKCLFGVRSTDDGKQYQAVYTQKFLRNNVKDYSRLDKDVQERKTSGAYPTTEFCVCELKEYTVEPTDLSSPASDSMPGMPELDIPSPYFD